MKKKGQEEGRAGRMCGLCTLEVEAGFLQLEMKRRREGGSWLSTKDLSMSRKIRGAMISRWKGLLHLR